MSYQEESIGQRIVNAAGWGIVIGCLVGSVVMAYHLGQIFAILQTLS